MKNATCDNPCFVVCHVVLTAVGDETLHDVARVRHESPITKTGSTIMMVTSKLIGIAVVRDALDAYVDDRGRGMI